MPNHKQQDPIDFLIVTRIPEKTYRFQWNVRQFSVLSKNKALYSTCIDALTTSCYLKLVKYEHGFRLFHVQKVQAKERRKPNRGGKGINYKGIDVYRSNRGGKGIDLYRSQLDSSESFNETSNSSESLDESSNSTELKLNLEYQVSATDCKGNELMKWSACFSDDSAYESCKIGEYINNRLERFPEDSLILDCNLKIISVPITEKILIASNPSLKSNSWKKLSMDFKAMYQSSKDTDVTLNVGTNKIHAHKLILTARSAVFKSIFNSDTEEAKKNSVSITDVEFYTLQRLVEFLYSGSIVDIENKDLNLELFNLYYAANQFVVLDLREMVGNSLMERIQVVDAIDILVLANDHDDKDLKYRAMNFIRNNFEEVSNTDAWESCVFHNPELAIEVVNFYFKTPESSVSQV